MNFLGMGPMELMLILVLALIVFGPGKLPEIAGQVGKTVRDFRRATSELSSEFNRTLSLEVEERKATAPAEPAPPAPVAATEPAPAVSVTTTSSEGAVAAATGGPATTVAAPLAATAPAAAPVASAASTNGDGWHWETSGAADQVASGAAPTAVAEPAPAPKTNGKARAADRTAAKRSFDHLAPPY